MTTNTFILVDADISDLNRALDTGALTSVELVSLYLHRIAKYDSNGPKLNSVCVLNPNIFEEAQASDDYRASGRPPRPLEGIPFTVKDSFKVKQMTVAAGAPAFADLIASSDAAIVESLRDAGAIVLGKTNMPAMADGGGQRGVYGRAESPYNSEYSTTAFASGSSNGSGTSTAASFASFGFGGETVSSGRAPASNNALIGYSPSRGILPIRGQWPLYPTCDVIVPHTRTMRDLFAVLNVIVTDDKYPEGDFWREQNFLSIPLSSEVRPQDYHSLADSNALKGKRIAVPKCYIGITDPSYPPAVFTESARELWTQARADLESLGAAIVETAFPLLKNYTKKLYAGQSANVAGFPAEWNSVERCEMIAMGWDDFLRVNKDKTFRNLTVVDPEEMHPLIAPMDDPKNYSEAENQVNYQDMIEAARNRSGTIYDLPGCEQALKALEAARKRDLEDWLEDNGFDLLVFPTNGDVARADAEENLHSMRHALQDGVKYSNGGRALKHLGVPAVTVPMGTLSDKQMPVGLTFCGRSYSDNDLLRYAFAYEEVSKRRTTPPLTPPLHSDTISFIPRAPITSAQSKPLLKLESIITTTWDSSDSQIRNVSLSGTIDHSDHFIQTESVTVFVDGESSNPVTTRGNKWNWAARLKRARITERYPTIRAVPKDQFMVVIVVKASNGRSAGALLLID